MHRVSSMRKQYVGADLFRMALILSFFVWLGLFLGGPLWPGFVTLAVILLVAFVVIVAYRNRKSVLAYHCGAAARGFMLVSIMVFGQAAYPPSGPQNWIWFPAAIGLSVLSALLRLWYDMANWGKTLADWEERGKINIDAHFVRVLAPWFRENPQLMAKVLPSVVPTIFIGTRLLKGVLPWKSMLPIHLITLPMIPIMISALTRPIAWSIRLRQIEKKTGSRFTTEFADPQAPKKS